MIRLTNSQPVALLGEAPPRVLVEPKGVRANSWEDVADLSAMAGITLDGWQETILRAAMGERTDKTWAAKRVGVTVPRQNGKSQLLVARVLAGALLFGEKKIVVSAHQQDTARESFGKLVEIIEDEANGWLRERIRPNGIMNAINREAIKFANGATVQFKARSGAGSRGFSADCLMLDEAQSLGARAWTSINSTMSAMPNPQVWLLGTAPQDEDDSETFENVRSAAIDGKSTSAAWCEWGADRESAEYKAAAADLAAKRWSPAVEYLCWSANPAWSARMNVEVVQGECETYAPLKFGQDRLGLWASEDGGRRLISADEWRDAQAPAVDGVRSLSVTFSASGKMMGVVGSAKHELGIHVEEPWDGDGPLGGPVDLGRVVRWLTDDPEKPERWRTFAQVTICGPSHDRVLYQALRDGGVPARVLHIPTTGEYYAACAMALESIRDGSLTRTAGQALLDASVAVSDKKDRGTEGAWGWNSTGDDGLEVHVEAMSLAHWSARTSKRKPGQKQRMVARR